MVTALFNYSINFCSLRERVYRRSRNTLFYLPFDSFPKQGTYLEPRHCGCCGLPFKTPLPETSLGVICIIIIMIEYRDQVKGETATSNWDSLAEFLRNTIASILSSLIGIIWFSLMLSKEMIKHHINATSHIWMGPNMLYVTIFTQLLYGWHWWTHCWFATQ